MGLMDGAAMSSECHTWQTPDEVLDLVRRVGEIALDPATAPSNPTRALRFFTEADNGLLKDWASEMFDWRSDDGACLSDTGLLFLNPPYGRALGKWVRKLAKTAREHPGLEMIALVTARPDTKWFQEHIAPTADALCFWKGRITFRGAEDPAPFPSLVAYWGPNDSEFREVFGPYGWIP